MNGRKDFLMNGIMRFWIYYRVGGVMIAVINDVSFQYPFITIESAVENMHRFLDICKRIEKDEITNIHEIKTGLIDSQLEIGPDYKLIQLIQEFKGREEKSLLLSILTNRGTYQEEKGDLFIIDGKESAICSRGIDNILISLLSNYIFSMPVVKGIVGEKGVELRNLSKDEHIDYYRNELGLRRYVANEKKHKFDRENPYGKGKTGSRMDLCDKEAQELLNKAVNIKGRLYAKKNGYYYAFQNERDIDYHGYRADDLGEDIKRQLDREFYDKCRK